MGRKTITLLGWALLPTGIILACMSSWWLTTFLFSDTFTFWKSLGAPSDRAVKIVEADRLNVWVEANNGQLFTADTGCYKNEICKKWVEVKRIYNFQIEDLTSIKRSENCEELDTEELPRNPNGIVTDCVLVIYPGPEYEIKTYYALMSDGSVRYWRYESSNWKLFFFIISNIVLSTIIIKIHKKVVANANAG